jgi:GTP cyclohydrolase I
MNAIGLADASTAERHADVAAAESAATAFLIALGVSLDEEHTRETPRRMASAYAELLSVEAFAMTTFDAAGHTGLVSVRNIAFTSLCAHHALPFAGAADISYLPSDRIVGLSKLARLVQAVASRLQVQEHLTAEIADRLEQAIEPRGIAVRLEAAHLCMTARGAQATGSVMVTTVLRGDLSEGAFSGGCDHGSTAHSRVTAPEWLLPGTAD